MFRFFNLLFPEKCVFCGKILESSENIICRKCTVELPFTEGAASIRRGDFFDQCVSPFYYSGSVRDSILRYKFKNRSSYARVYAKFFSDCITQMLGSRFELITWVPVSKKRLRERGYDQAELLAKAVALQFNMEAVPTLRKVKDTQAQSGISGAEKRRANIMGAYAVIDPGLIKGKRILIIDDVITTGSTMSECARMLMLSGAEEIVCATLAKKE